MNFQGLKFVFQKPELGLLIIRCGVGVLLAIYGYRKFAAGEPVLRGVGSAINSLGLNIATDGVIAISLGIMAASAELFGGVLITIGFFFRPAVILALFTMFVAVMSKLAASGGLSDYGHPLLYALVLGGLLFTGPGRMSIQKD
jgi:putative oxidoreductase